MHVAPSVADELPILYNRGGAAEREKALFGGGIAGKPMCAKNATNTRTMLRGLSTLLLGAVRYGLTIAIFCAVWWFDARYLNRAFDANLAIIKTASGLVDGSGKSEAMLRAFAAEKMLLFGEGSAAIWALGCAAVALKQRLFADHSGSNTKAPAKSLAVLLAISVAAAI